MPRVAAVLLFAALVLAAPSAWSQARNICADRALIVEKLASVHGETRRGLGLHRDRGVVEVWASESGSWTIIVTMPNGVACLVAAGENWRDDDMAPVIGDGA